MRTKQNRVRLKKSLLKDLSLLEKAGDDDSIYEMIIGYRSPVKILRESLGMSAPTAYKIIDRILAGSTIEMAQAAKIAEFMTYDSLDDFMKIYRIKKKEDE